MDTIYGNPKSVREKVEFLNTKKQNHQFMSGDGDYGHATIFFPKNIKGRFYSYWFEGVDCFYINYYKTFLKNGKPSYEVWYNKDGSFNRKYSYKYDDKNNLIIKKDSGYYESINVKRHYYDYKGNLQTVLSHYLDEYNSYSYRIYKYDNLDRLIREEYYSEEGYHYSFNRFYNEEDDKLIRIERHFPLGKLKTNTNDNEIVLYTYDYDKLGNITRELRFNEETQMVNRKIVYEYDDFNNLIKRTSYRSLTEINVFDRQEYTFNKKNLKIKEKRISSTLDNEVMKMQYSENNYIIEVNLVKGDKEYKIKFDYKFDKNGNWVKVIKNVNDEPLYIWTREIEYY